MFQGGKLFKNFNLNDIILKYYLCDDEFSKHFENIMLWSRMKSIIFSQDL